MITLKLNREGLYDLHPEELIGKNTMNGSPPGTGKSRYIYFMLSYAMAENLKVMVCLPNHNMIHEFRNREPWLLEWSVHYEGKGRLCLRDDGAWKAYMDHCKGCKQGKECRYIQQFQHDKNIVFIVKEHLYNIGTFKPDILIVDESIDGLVWKAINIPSALRGDVKFEKLESCEVCPFKPKCNRYGRFKNVKRVNGKHEVVGGSIPCYRRLDFSKINIEEFEPQDLMEKFFKGALQQYKDIFAVWDEELHDFKIIGHQTLDFLEVDTLIFNCATTSLELAEYMFGKKFDVLIQSDEELKNDITVLDETMTVRKSEVFLDNMGRYMELFDIPVDESTLIYTKEKFEKIINIMFPHILTGHYGDSRGTNRFEGVETVIILGRFWLRESHRMLLGSQGLTTSMIDSFSVSEEEQAFHRARPILNPDVGVYMFTDTLHRYGKIPEPKLIAKENQYEIAMEILIKRDELEGLTKSEIYKLVTKKKFHVSYALDILYRLKKIKSMVGRGAQLEFI